jgi:ABC-type uncharacterized transport system permease subunit
MIKNGDFAYEMLRPLDLYNYWYFKILAQRIAGTVLRAVPIILTAAVILPENYSLQGPASFSAFMFFLISFISFRSQMEYKLSFIYMTAGYFIVTFIEFIALYALFNRFGNISGWTLYEVAVFYGVFNTSFAIKEIPFFQKHFEQKLFCQRDLCDEMGCFLKHINVQA